VFGSSAYGEGAYGETSGATTGIGAVDGVMHIVEAPDLVAITGRVPVVSVSAIADGNMLVVVVELQLAQLGLVLPSGAAAEVFEFGVFEPGVYV
jgi:hypothetical protein